jgi:hypothetical protein
VSAVQAEKTTPKEVVEIMGPKYHLDEIRAKVLIDFFDARQRRDHRLHGAEADFERMREELGEAFPDPLERVDVVNDFENLFC